MMMIVVLFGLVGLSAIGAFYLVMWLESRKEKKH